MALRVVEGRHDRLKKRIATADSTAPAVSPACHGSNDKMLLARFECRRFEHNCNCKTDGSLTRQYLAVNDSMCACACVWTYLRGHRCERVR